MAMSQEMQGNMVKVLVQKLGTPICPACSHQNLFLHEDFLLPLTIVMEEKGNEIKSQGIASVAMICSNCGHYRLFSASVLGLIPNITPPEAVSPDSQ